MTSQLHKRLERLEALLAARVAPPIWRWQMDPNGDAAAELERMVAEGEIAEKDKGRVQIWRWLTDAEALEQGIVHPEPKPPQQSQLPAPPELKLLPAPPKAPDVAHPQVKEGHVQQPTPPEVQAKRALTEEQLRKLLEDRERPFGRPIKYPRGIMGMP
jgi:hypothetical protein